MLGEQMKRSVLAVASVCGLVASGTAFEAAAQPAPSDPAATNVPSLAPALVPVAPNSPAQRPDIIGSFLERGTKITDRPRPELDPLGIRLGSFFFYPRGELDEMYNDNIFATGSGRVDDWITVLAPTMELKSNWSNHALDLKAGANVGTYARRSTENYGDYFASADGRFDITRNVAAFGGFKYEHLHEARDNPDTTLAAANPVEFDAYTINAGIANRGLRFGYQFDVGYRKEDFESSKFVGTGIPFSNAVRDANIYTTSARFSYEIAPRYEAWARIGFNRREYENNNLNVIAGVAQSRDSQGYRMDVGATIDLTGVTFAEFYIGYLIQDYDNAFYGSIDGVDAGARLIWNATQLTSVVLSADRRVQDANSTATSGPFLVLSPGYLRSNIGVSVDHELLRNVLLNGRFNYQNDDYQKIDRTDDRIDAGAGVRYALNRNFYLGGSYTYTHRSSSGAAAGGDFGRNLFLLRLGAQL